jgi:hypothetical protein
LNGLCAIGNNNAVFNLQAIRQSCLETLNHWSVVGEPIAVQYGIDGPIHYVTPSHTGTTYVEDFPVHELRNDALI